MPASSTDRVVVLTGANRGIGHAMLSALVDDGYRVAGLDLDGDDVRAVQDRAPDRVIFLECDVTDTDDVDAAVEAVLDRWGRIDILVNNAAVATVAPFEAQTIDDTRREFEVNVFGYLRLIRAVLPHMRARGDGIIHNVGSPTGEIGHPSLSGYAATKGAVGALTRSLRLELRRTGVSCTLLVPPATDTRMVAGLGYPEWLTAPPEEVGRKFAARIESTDRVISPDRSTRLGLFLLEWIPGLWPKLTERLLDPTD